MAIRIHELNHVALHVRDINASMQFYGEVLELPLLARPAFDFPGAWFALGSQELHLIEEKTLPEAERRHHHFALLVDDTQEAQRELAAKGVVNFHRSVRPDGVAQLFFQDPDGYRIEMYTVATEK